MDSDFRIFADDTQRGTVFSIHEVFYDKDKNPVDYIHVPIVLISSNQEDLITDIQLALEAWERPFLSMKDFPNEW